jgi:hypothetical protein
MDWLHVRFGAGQTRFRPIDMNRHICDPEPARTVRIRRIADLPDRALERLNWADTDLWPNGRKAEGSGHTRGAGEGTHVRHTGLSVACEKTAEERRSLNTDASTSKVTYADFTFLLG